MANTNMTLNNEQRASVTNNCRQLQNNYLKRSVNFPTATSLNREVLQKKSSFRLNFITISLILIIAGVGSTFQLYHILDIYYARQTTVVVKSEKLDKFELPAFSICGWYKRFINREKLYKKYPHIKRAMDEIKRNSSEDWLAYWIRTTDPLQKLVEPLWNSLTIDEIHNLLPDPKDIVPWCEVWLANDKQPIPCEFTNFWNFSVTVETEWFCFTYLYRPFNQRWTTKRIFVEPHNGHEWGNFLRFDIYHHLHNQINSMAWESFYKLIIHAPHETIHSPNSQVVHIHAKKIHEVLFGSVTNVRLPPPYKTNCRNYTEIGYESRRECLNLCRGKHVAEKCKGWPQLTPTKPGVKLKFADSNCVKSHNLFATPDQCYINCQWEDCIEEHYTFSELGTWELQTYNKDTYYKESRIHSYEPVLHNFASHVAIKLPFGPHTTYIHQPKIEFIEFICYVASIFSLWFGVSFVSVTFSINRFVNNCKNRKIAINA